MNDHSGHWLSHQRPFRPLLSGLLCALLLSNAYGQEPTAEENQAVEKAAQAEKSAKSTAPVKAPPVKAQNDKSSSKPTSEVFRPSEEISEDLSVPFPVDI